MCANKDIYSESIKEQRKRNMQQVKPLLESGDKALLSKIKKAAERYDIKPQDIYDDILTERPTALALFSKDPLRQKIHENIAADYIKNIDGVADFKNLSNRELHVCKGTVINNADLKVYPSAKTIDFHFKYNGYNVYVSHKHTTESGGAQDNQYKDLQGFIRECRDSTTLKQVFIAIADGDYYRKQNGRVGLTRIDNLRNKCTRSVRACTIYELNSVLRDLS